MNERSFIVKSDLKSVFLRWEIGRSGYRTHSDLNRAKDALLSREFRNPD